ncbi:GNAT family N-acetyltransferase [Sulfitobacter sabulilitoris]|uniref:GNAT family N-acetyltransferase n=1 Tax=Sulfitobacter sabulilitoris TaxID=2562655 RepID=A0A5S3PK85_9RHOB|nr:GNAT family N-acetyltransferase [Sulfitobacter sabulilitoris]TMM54819.1 GNAT family N-acetyltransferase [Sulfitobacter sabulilitoris]
MTRPAPPAFRVRAPATRADMEAVRSLCWEYRDFLLGFDADVARMTHRFYPEPLYRDLMARLEQEHARPWGAILSIEAAGRIGGCGMIKPVFPGKAEIKRVFLRPALRGSGAGRALCRALIDRARADGYTTIYLDTARAFTPARRLYERLGFTERGPYAQVPPETLPLLSFYELTL